MKQGLYRVRLLNGCNARIFNVALDNGEKLNQISSDGGLLSQVNSLEKFYYAPAERFEFLIDFSNYNEGDTVKVESLPLVEGRGEKYTIFEFEVGSEAGEAYEMPTMLANVEKIDPNSAHNLNSPKQFELIPARGKGWTINGSIPADNS